MQIEKVDALIVGSGPSGTSTALHLLQQNPEWSKRIALVDKATHPRQKLCGGGVTHMGQNILADLGLPFEPNNFEIREVKLVYRDKSYSFYGNPVFRVTRRDEFDHWLVQKVEAKDVPVYQGEAVKMITPHEDHVEVVTEKRTFQAQVLVGADGSRSFVRRALKWDDDSRVSRLLEVLTPENPQIQPEFQGKTAVFDFTQMPAGLQGYYWDFPSHVNGEPFMNRGLFDSRACPKRPKADLKQMLRHSLAERERALDDYQLKGHPIRWWDRRGKFAMPRIILVGDAAGADPLFGEGIAFALGYGRVAAPAIADALARQDFRFADYKKRLLADPLFFQLRLRGRLAKIVYRLNAPWLFRLGWRVAPLVVRLTPWRSREYVPGRAPVST